MGEKCGNIEKKETKFLSVQLGKTLALTMYVCLLPISQHHTDIIDWETCDI